MKASDRSELPSVEIQDTGQGDKSKSISVVSANHFLKVVLLLRLIQSPPFPCASFASLGPTSSYSDL